jgi:hypothetical protein
MNHQFSAIVDTTAKSEQEMLEIADALGNAGCLDASVGGHDEGVELSFNRDAPSLDTAIKSAVAEIEGAGYRVKRVEMTRDAISLEA